MCKNIYSASKTFVKPYVQEEEEKKEKEEDEEKRLIKQDKRDERLSLRFTKSAHARATLRSVYNNCMCEYFCQISVYIIGMHYKKYTNRYK